MVPLNQAAHNLAEEYKNKLESGIHRYYPVDIETGRIAWNTAQSGYVDIPTARKYHNPQKHLFIKILPSGIDHRSAASFIGLMRKALKAGAIQADQLDGSQELKNFQAKNQLILPGMEIR